MGRNKTLYSVQLSLTEEIQRTILKNHYLYVSVEYNPAGNDPTSNPYLLAQQWCRVASDKGSASDLEKFEKVKAKLRTILEDKRAEIGEGPYEDGLRLIAFATVNSAVPVLFIIPPDADGFDLAAGDLHAGYELTEEEYLIPNLKPSKTFEVRRLDCSAIETLR